jgi:hypothetical protein
MSLIENGTVAQQHKRAAVYDNLDLSGPYEPPVYPKSNEIRDMLRSVVQQNILFRSYKTEEHAAIVEAFEPMTCQSSEVIINQGKERSLAD